MNYIGALKIILNMLYALKLSSFLTFIIIYNAAGYLNAQSPEKSIPGEPSSVLFYGHATKAQDYSNTHDVIAFTVMFGANAPYSDEQIVKMIDENVFTGEIEAPIAVFIEPKKPDGKSGAIFKAYIRGESYRDDYTGEKYFTPEELVKTAPQLVNKMNDPTRTIDKNPVYFTKKSRN